MAATNQITIEVRDAAGWRRAATASFAEPAAGIRGPCRVDYDIDYAIDQIGEGREGTTGLAAVATACPVDLVSYYTKRWPAWLDGIRPGGASRRWWVARLGLTPRTMGAPVKLDARALTPEARTEVLEVLRRAVAVGDLTAGQALRLLRAAYLRVSRERFAKMTGVSARAIAKLEAGTGNPTLDTLTRVFRPFGFQIGLVPRAGTVLAEAPPAVDEDAYETVLAAARAAEGSRGR